MSRSRKSALSDELVELRFALSTRPELAPLTAAIADLVRLLTWEEWCKRTRR